MFNPFKKSYSQEEQKLFSFLKRNYLFSRLADEELAEFLPNMYLRHYERGEVIFFRNDPSQALYLVNRGMVALSIDVGEKFEELTHLRTYEAFGENALLEGRKRTYNAICFSERCDLYVIPTASILEIYSRSTPIHTKLMTALAEYYESYTANMFRSYQDSFGFFHLGSAFSRR